MPSCKPLLKELCGKLSSHRHGCEYPGCIWPFAHSEYLNHFIDPSFVNNPDDLSSLYWLKMDRLSL